MGEEEEVTEQQRFQQSIERRLNEESQARSAMEEQLKSIHTLLGKLVDGNNQAGSTGVTISSNNSSSSITNAGMLATLPQSSGQPTVTGSIIQPVMTYAKSSAKAKVRLFPCLFSL